MQTKPSTRIFKFRIRNSADRILCNETPIIVVLTSLAIPPRLDLGNASNQFSYEKITLPVASAGLTDGFRLVQLWSRSNWDKIDGSMFEHHPIELLVSLNLLFSNPELINRVIWCFVMSA